MKINIDKKDGWITLVPETQLDYFYLGRMSTKVGCVYETTSDTDVRKEKLKTFQVETKNMVRVLQK